MSREHPTSYAELADVLDSLPLLVREKRRRCGLSLRAAATPLAGGRMTTKADLRTQIRDLLEEREELLPEIRRLRMGNHPAGRALRPVDESAWRDLQAAMEARDAEHEGGAGA